MSKQDQSGRGSITKSQGDTEQRAHIEDPLRTPLIRTGLEPTERPRTACRGQAAGGRGGGAASRLFCFFIKAGLQVLGQEAGGRSLNR